MSNKEEFRNAASKILTESQLNAAMLFHNVIFESTGKNYDPEFAAFMESLDEDELQAVLESLEYDDLQPLMEWAGLVTGAARAAMQIPKLWKGWRAASALKSTASAANKLNKARAIPGNAAKIQKAEQAFATKAAKADQALAREQQFLKGYDNKFGTHAASDRMNSYKQITKGDVTGGGIMSGKYGNPAMQAYRQENLPHVQNIIKQNQDKITTLQAENAKLQAEIKTVENSIQGRKFNKLTPQQKTQKQMELANKKAQLEKNTKDIQSYENQNIKLSKEYETIPGTNTVYGTAQTTPINQANSQSTLWNGMSAASMGASAASMATPRMTNATMASAEMANPALQQQMMQNQQTMLQALTTAISANAQTLTKSIIGNRAKKSLVSKVMGFGSLALTAYTFKGVWDSFGGGEWLSDKAGILTKAIAMLGAGYVGSKVPEMLGLADEDNTTAKLVGGASTALLVAYLMNIGKDNGEKYTKEEATGIANQIANMNPADQKYTLDNLGITDPSVISKMTRDNNANPQDLVSTLSSLSSLV